MSFISAPPVNSKISTGQDDPRRGLSFAYSALGEGPLRARHFDEARRSIELSARRIAVKFANVLWDNGDENPWRAPSSREMRYFSMYMAPFAQDLNHLTPVSYRLRLKQISFISCRRTFPLQISAGHVETRHCCK